MKTQTKFKEYIWLVNTIRKARRISFAEINERWIETEMSGGVEMARSTFNRNMDAIEEMFGIYIDCDRKNGNKYYIGNAEVLKEDTIQNWMLSTLSVSNIVSESLSVQNRILLESIPSEGEHLQIVIDAMREKHLISIDYRRYGTDEHKLHTFAPYCVKLFNKRWYVLGRFHYDNSEGKSSNDFFAIFSFDRILNVEITENKFTFDKDFDAATFFHDYYGVLIDDEVKLERVVIRAFNYERYYMQDLPLHSSQRIVGNGDNYIDFELRLRPTVDFCAKLQSRGCLIKVLEPEWLANNIRQMHLDAAKLYEKK